MSPPPAVETTFAKRKRGRCHKSCAFRSGQLPTTVSLTKIKPFFFGKEKNAEKIRHAPLGLRTKYSDAIFRERKQLQFSLLFPIILTASDLFCGKGLFASMARFFPYVTTVKEK